MANLYERETHGRPAHKLLLERLSLLKTAEVVCVVELSTEDYEIMTDKPKAIRGYREGDIGRVVEAVPLIMFCFNGERVRTFRSAN